MSILWGCFFLPALLFKPTSFFLLCSFFLILALGDPGGPYEIFDSVLRRTHILQCLGRGTTALATAGPQAIGEERGRLEPQVMLGEEGGAGWQGGAWAQSQFWELGKRARAGGRPWEGTKGSCERFSSETLGQV